MKNETNQKIKSGKIILLVAGAALGIFLLIFGSGIASESDDEPDTAGTPENVYDAEEYRKGLENSISALCSQVRGAGNVTVTVSLDGSYKAVYAQNVQNSISSGGNTSKSEYVLTGSGSSKSALIIGYSPPQIIGVGIVCTGGGDAAVKQEIINLVSAAYGVTTNKIYVAGAKN